jgi:23S rRNA (guanine745-N1)-methyltransferase
MAWELFICPVCRQPLTLSAGGASLRCLAGHNFDIARAGYASLVTGAGAHADTAAMVRARATFLADGWYAPIAQRLADLIQSQLPPIERTPRPVLADLGGGTGWYAARLLDRIPRLDGLLIDASAPAARIAARAHPRLVVATADLWATIPLADTCVDIALVVFAPRNPDQIQRILAPTGCCLVVTPQPHHLAELRPHVPLLGIEPAKSDRLARQFAAFRHQGDATVEYAVTLTPAAIDQVVHMGPSAHHLGPTGANPLTAVGSLAQTALEVSVAVRIDVFCLA